MNENIISILKNFGWTEGFRVPIANEENKTLESKAEKIYEKRVQLTSHLKECQDRLNLVKYYSNSVTEERKHYQEIHSTCKEQQIVETLLCKKITIERKAIKNEITEISTKRNQLFQDNADLKFECEKILLEIAKLKNILDWGKELESIWIEYTNSEYERVDLLKKLQLKNYTKLEQIEVQRLNLCSERDEYNANLQQKYQNILETECSLRKLLELQQKLRKERNQSIDKWEWLIQVITSRDQEVIRLSEEMNILAKMSTNLKTKILEKKHFYREQTRCNIRAEIDIRREEIQFSNQTSLKENLNQQLEQLESKIVDYRRNLFSLNVEISKNRSSIANTKKMIGYEANIVREMTSKNEQAVKKRLQTKVLYSSVEERIKELTRILQDEKIKLNSLQSNCKKFEIRIHKQNFSLADCERLLLAYDYEIEDLKHANVRLDTDDQRCEQQIERQMNILSDLNEKLIELVKHIQYVKGDKINQMANEQKKYLTNILAYYNYQMKIFEQLNKDFQHFQLETTTLKKTVAHYVRRMDALQNEKEKLLLLIHGYEQRLNATTERNQQKLVSENITRTRVDYLENALAKSTDKMLNLKKQKVEIDVLFCKHNFEMRATWNILKNRKKLMNQEISNLKYPIEQIKRRIRQQMKRYEIITDGIKKDDNGIPLNVTNYKIQMTKERYALLEKGDELDVSVRKAEKEIQAMENTLTLLNASNNVCKRNSSTMTDDENAKEAFKYEEKKQQKFELSTIHKKIGVTMRKTKNEISRYQVALSIELLPKIDQLEKTKEKKESDYAQMCRTANTQLLKMNRVQARIKRTKKTFKTSHTSVRVLEQEFISKQMFELNRCVLRRITQLCKQHDELNAPVHQYLTAKGISLPRT